MKPNRLLKNSKVDKPLDRLIQEKYRLHQSTKLKNERENITIDTTKIQDLKETTMSNYNQMNKPEETEKYLVAYIVPRKNQENIKI